MNKLLSFANYDSREQINFRVLTEAKQQGKTHAVNVTAVGIGLQRHLFESLKEATDFYKMAKINKEHWSNPSKPFTINSALRQCWS